MTTTTTKLLEFCEAARQLPAYNLTMWGEPTIFQWLDDPKNLKVEEFYRKHHDSIWRILMKQWQVGDEYHNVLDMMGHQAVDFFRPRSLRDLMIFTTGYAIEALRMQDEDEGYEQTEG